MVTNILEADSDSHNQSECVLQKQFVGKCKHKMDL
jgi:hypothetical protein